MMLCYVLLVMFIVFSLLAIAIRAVAFHGFIIDGITHTFSLEFTSVLATGSLSPGGAHARIATLLEIAHVPCLLSTAAGLSGTR